MRTRHYLGSTALGTAAFAAFAVIAPNTAFAQTSPETDTDTVLTDDAAVEAPPESPAEDKDIVVTGSRIRRTEASSASPIQIIDPALGQKQGQQDLAELIQSSPIVAGSSQITSAISTNAVTNGGPGAQTVSLRGLGAERTLVLLNGRRAGPAGTRGGVSAFDLNVLPQSIVKSIEILKDGASSVYGSDAVAGVVNILTKTDTDGIEFDGFASIPEEGGGETYQLSATWGKDFGSGHVLVSGDYYKRQELERRDRKYLGCPEDYLFRKDGKTRADLIDPRTGKYQCSGTVWGHVWTYYAYNLPDQSVVLLQPDYGQNLGQYIDGVPPATGFGDLSAPPGYFPVNILGDGPTNAITNLYHPFEQKSSVIPETERKTAYIEGAYDITDKIEIYGEFLYNNRKTYNDTYTQIYNFGYATNDDPYAEGYAFQGFSAPFGGAVILSPTGLVDDVDNKTDVDYYRGVAGLRGEIGSNFSWDIYGQYSRSDGNYTYQQVLKDSINLQNYKTESCVGTFTPISNRPCIDINWVSPDFLAGNLSQAERDYLFGTETGNTLYIQKYVEASITGDLFNLPAGPVGVALGGVYRQDSIDDQPGNITQAPNPDFDPTLSVDDPDYQPEFVDNAFANPISSGHTFGKSVTKELFGEINVPVLANSIIAKSLDLSAAVRVTNVTATRGSDGAKDSNNGNVTYKLLGNWQINDWVRVRGTYGTSFRAPALFEQFLAAQVSGARQANIDPCVNSAIKVASGAITKRQFDNCVADGIPTDHNGSGIQASVFNSGGLGELTPEKSRAISASVILTPKFEFLPDTDISLTVDYFNIEVTGEITQLGAANIVYGCYNSINFPTDPLCSLFERNQDGNPDNIRNVFDKFININRQENRGFDVTARVGQDLGSLGRVSLIAQMTWQTTDNVTLFDGTTENNNAEIGDPRFVGDFKAVWDLDDTSFFYGMEVIGNSSSVSDFIRDNGSLCNLSPDGVSTYGGDYCYVRDTPAVFYHNASVTQSVGDKFDLTLGVSNLFDTRPPRISTGSTTIGQSPFVSQYDWLGRRFFVGVKAKF